MSTLFDGYIEFDCTGSDGASHHYRVPYKTADDRGIEISLWFLANLGSLVTGLVPVLKGVIERYASEGSAALDAGLFESLAENLTTETLAGVAKELRMALITPEARGIVKDLVAGGMRDDVSIQSTMAITYRGNWTEFYTAVWRLVVANGFFPWPDTSAKTTG